MAAAATATYALTSRGPEPAPASEQSEPTVAAETPAPTAAEAAAAKETLCAAFLQTTKGSTGRGGVVTDGELNTPNVLRILGSVVTIQRVTTDAVPSDLAGIAHTFIDRKLDLANAALATEPIEELVRLTDRGNEAARSFAAACGIAY